MTAPEAILEAVVVAGLFVCLAVIGFVVVDAARSWWRWRGIGRRAER